MNSRIRGQSHEGIKITQLEVMSISILLLILAASLIPRSPLYTDLLDRDPGVYQYISWRVIHGDAVYRDAWDHKPPMIYLLNVLAFRIGGLSEWSIWALEVIFVVLFLCVLYICISRLYSSKTAFIVLLLVILSLTRLGIYNVPELYALLFQVGIIYIFLLGNSRSMKLNYILIGVLGALCFFTKQSNIGLFLVVALWPFYQLLTKKISIRGMGMKVALLSVGFFLPTAIILLYFYLSGTLEMFWSAAFVFNFVHTKSTLLAKIEAVIFGLDLLRTLTAFSVFALAGWCISLLSFIRPDGRDNKLYFMVVFGMMVEMALSGLSPYQYHHYYLALLPIFSLSSSVIIHEVDQILVTSGKYKNAYWVIFLVIILSTQLSAQARGNYWPFVDRTSTPPQNEMVDYIRTNSDPDDTVLILGAEARINYLARRESPTRFVYQYPITNRYYSNEEMRDEFLSDIRRNKPRLVIDAKSSKILSWQDYNPDWLYSLLTRDFFIESCHQDISSPNTNGWDVYICDW